MSHKIGVDGGGTKTECILIDGSGTVVARHIAPGCNPNVIGREQAAFVVRTALAELLSLGKVPAVSAILLCLAGNRAFWREFAASLTGFGRVTATDDSLPVLELATEGGPGMVLHAGTGSFVAARGQAGATADVQYAGGLGFRFGDPGSGYDIGRRAIARGLLELQGWSPPSGLGRLIPATTGLAATDAILGHFYNDPAPNLKIAALAPEVLRLAAAGDRVAAALLIESASGLLDLALAVAAKIFPGGPPPRTGLSGTLLTHPLVAQALSARAPFPLTPLSSPPIEGVRRLLLRYPPSL